ncbi:MAG TPA: aminotransferase class V-fold PLP-dependent enzyme [Candidatus Bathyarchaeota archaeon]|nr:aminotransferase class V-fold PLP-dependent enzyme [Candidatus Bathyarchaeota archaeon]
MDIHDVRKQLPIVERKIFLNHAATSPLPICAAKAMRKFLSDKIRFQSIRDIDLDSWLKKIADSKKLFSKLIGAGEHEIARIPNTTFGLNLIAQMLPCKPGDNVVTNTLEYPSNVIVWLKLKEKDVEVRFVKDINGKISLDELEKSVDDRTVAVAIGQVGWFNGFRHNLKAISEIAHDKGAFLVVDAIQAVGNMRIDVTKEGIDFLSCGSYKWLLGPPGAGFLYVRKDLIDEFNPPILGENSLKSEVVKTNIYERFDLFELKYSQGISKYEVVHLNDIAFIGVSESMRLLLDFGIENIEKRIETINDYLIERLLENGYEIRTPLSKEERHAIINFKIRDPNKAVEFLSKNGIIVSRRVGGIRVSPHFYNTEEEIDKFIEALKNLK